LPVDLVDTGIAVPRYLAWAVGNIKHFAADCNRSPMEKSTQNRLLAHRAARNTQDSRSWGIEALLALYWVEDVMSYDPEA